MRRKTRSKDGWDGEVGRAISELPPPEGPPYSRGTSDLRQLGWGRRDEPSCSGSNWGAGFGGGKGQAADSQSTV